MRHRLALILLVAAIKAGAQWTFYSPSGRINAGEQGPLSPPPETAPPDQRCSVSGRVVNALTSESVKRASVRLVWMNLREGEGASAMGYTAQSGPDGTFHLDGVQPGRYRVSAQHNGFLAPRIGRRSRTATEITLGPGQSKTDISVALTPQAVISGKFVDEDGEPVPHATVQVLKRTWLHGVQCSLPVGGEQTNDLGQFRLSNLVPGRYVLSAQVSSGETAIDTSGKVVEKPSSSEPRPVRTFYPGVLSSDEATPVEVQAGQELSGLELRQRSARTYRVRGRIAEMAPKDSTNPNFNGAVTIAGRDDVMPFGNGGGPIGADGKFAIDGLQPGHYTLRAMTFEDDRMIMRGKSEVEVSASDVDNVVLRSDPAITLRGRVQVEEANRSSKVNYETMHIGLSFADILFSGDSGTQAKADGTFAITDLEPGRYLLMTGVPKGWYVKSAYLGRTEVAHSFLNISAGGEELVLTLGNDLGTISGSVRFPDNNAEDTPQPGDTQVVLLPDTPYEDEGGAQFAQADLNGTFQLNQVPPGRYRIFAIESLDREDLQNPEIVRAIRDSGTMLEVKSSANAQAAPVLLTAKHYSEILARAALEPAQN